MEMVYIMQARQVKIIHKTMLLIMLLIMRKTVIHGNHREITLQVIRVQQQLQYLEILIRVTGYR